MVDGFMVNQMSQTFTLLLGFSHNVATKIRGKLVQSCFLFLPMAVLMSARLANGSQWMTDVELFVTVSLHARLSRKSLHKWNYIRWMQALRERATVWSQPVTGQVMTKVTLPGFLIQSGLSLEEQPRDLMSSELVGFVHSKKFICLKNLSPLSCRWTTCNLWNKILY